MADKRFVKDLGKLVIAAAWIDGELAAEEINSLKDLVFSLPDITGEDWNELELYIDARVGESERKRLLENVLSGVRSQKDKDLVLDTLSGLVESDGVVTEDEAALLDEVKVALEEKNTGILNNLASLVGGAVKKRNSGYRAASNRESRLDDYIQNAVFFDLVSEMEARGKTITMPEEEIRRLCLAGGLMAHVAWIGETVSEREKAAIRDALVRHWGATEEKAALVSEISLNRVLKGIDYYRLTRSFFDCTSSEDRKAFLETLFDVANAAGRTSNAEIEEIRKVAQSLKLSHRDFIEAKLTISREDRGGL